jgi:hypothetical protein
MQIEYYSERNLDFQTIKLKKLCHFIFIKKQIESGLYAENIDSNELRIDIRY